MPTTLHGDDAELVTQLAAVRVAMEAANTAIFNAPALTGPQIDNALDMFTAGLQIIRQIIPDHVLNTARAAAGHPTAQPRPALHAVPTPTDAA